MKHCFKALVLAATVTIGSFTQVAVAEVTVGVSLSATGPAAALGIPGRNTLALLPDTIAGEKVRYIFLDDATDSSQAGRNARKLIEEDKVDVILGSASTPAALAIAEVANEMQTPQVSASPVELPADKNKWVFRTPQHNQIMSDAIVEHMQANGYKSLGFIGYADAYGDSWLGVTKKSLADTDIELIGVERFNRNDTSVTGQAVKLVAANPDAILIVASGTPSVLPQVTLQDRGFKGQIYQTHGTASKDYIRVGGKAVEGTILPVGPVIVADQLPDSHPSKKVGIEYTKLYEDKYGEGSLSAFGAYFYDAYLLLKAALPQALENATPGTQAFRDALRDSLEASTEVVGTHGVFNMTADDHFGLDDRSRVLVVVEDGDWKLLESEQE